MPVFLPVPGQGLGTPKGGPGSRWSARLDERPNGPTGHRFERPGLEPFVKIAGSGAGSMPSRSLAADAHAEIGKYPVIVTVAGPGDPHRDPDAGPPLRHTLARPGNGIWFEVARPPVLIGASLGGNASLAALGHFPELALVLVDVSPFLQPASASQIRAFMTARAEEGFGSLQEAADAVAAYLPHRRRPRNLDGLRKNLRQADGRWYWHWDPPSSRSPRSAGTARPAHRPRLGAAATSLRVPTLLVRATSVQDARWMRGWWHCRRRPCRPGSRYGAGAAEWAPGLPDDVGDQLAGEHLGGGTRQIWLPSEKGLVPPQLITCGSVNAQDNADRHHGPRHAR